MLSNASARSANATQQQQTDEITVNGSVYRRANMAQATYRISTVDTLIPKGALVDGGANGGMNGEDCRIIEYVEGAHVDVTGINQIQIDELKICLSAGFTESTEGPICVFMGQYADLGKGPTIHSKGQMEHYGCIVDDTSRRNGGRQCIITPEGYVIPLSIRDGLPRFDMRPPTDAELEKYPHVYLTSDSPWDPAVLDTEYEPEVFFDAMTEDPDVVARREARDPRVDSHGFLRSREDYQTLFRAQEAFIAEQMARSDIWRGTSENVSDVFYDASMTGMSYIDPFGTELPNCELQPKTTFERMVNKLTAMPNRLRKVFPQIDQLKPYFGWASTEKIQAMLDKTTQHYRATIHFPFRKHFKTRFPAANVRRLNEWQAMDTFFSDTPAGDDGIPGHGGCTMMQLFVGLKSKHLAGYPMKSEKQVAEAMEDHIRKVGAPIGIKSDMAKSEMHGRAKDIMRMYEIDDCHSEPYNEWQNDVERYVQNVKRTMNNTMDRTGCPQKWWLLCALFCIMILNVLPNVHGEIPQTVVTGEVQDISKFMHYHFWQEVFVESHKEGKREEKARWCYPANNVGDELTYWVLLNDTKELVARSNVRPAADPLYPNLRLRPTETKPVVETVTEDEPARGESPSMPATSGEPENPGSVPSKTSKSPIYNLQDQFDVPVKLPRFAPDKLLGMTFLHDIGDGQVVRAKIVKKVEDLDAKNHERIKMLVSYDDDRIEEIITYNKLCDIVAEQHNAEAGLSDEGVFTFREVQEHEGPFTKGHHKWRGSAYNVKVLWDDGSVTWEPLSLMIASDPVTLAVYAKEHDLLETPGWKKLKKYAKNAKKLKRMLNQSRRQNKNDAVRYKFGIRIPRSVKEAYALDAANGNTYWADAMKAEIDQLNEYSVYHSIGKNARPPPGYQQIPLRMVFDVKQSLKRKARLVARGDKTSPPDDSVYSGVASLRSLRIVVFLAELNGLKVTGGDIGNAYLEAYTKEKVCFRAGPEFGELEGHLCIIDKALYGLRTSGARFHAKFAETLRALGSSYLCRSRCLDTRCW